jgi:hypothetical protein
MLGQMPKYASQRVANADSHHRVRPDVVRLQMEVIQKLPQEAARRQREAPLEVLEEHYRFTGLWRGHPLATGRAAPHQIFRRD